MIIPLPESVTLVINTLLANNYEAFVVGGCVRNSLLGLPVKDYDITTNALPAEVKQVFGNYKVIETGIQHGTVTIVINEEPIEITTYRTDGTYSDNRHPDNVEFTTSLRDDLSRRDFTVNAIAYNHEKGIIDYFGGSHDLDKKIIRCVGNPETRFKEDSLRILRALRFASVYGFEIEENTSNAMNSCKELIKNISIERITSELNGFIVGENAGKLLLKYRDIFAQFIPEIKPTFDMEQDNPHHDKDIWEHTCSVVENSENDLEVRLAALFHDIGKAHCKTIDKNGIGHFYGHPDISAKMAEKIMQRLRQPKVLSKNVVMLVKYHDRLRDLGIKGIRRLYGKTGYDIMIKLLMLTRADAMGQSSYRKDEKIKGHAEKQAIVKKIIDENLCCTIEQLDINGNDLISLGITNGKEIGERLKFLLKSVIDGKVENQKADLIDFLSTASTGMSRNEIVLKNNSVARVSDKENRISFFYY